MAKTVPINQMSDFKNPERLQALKEKAALSEGSLFSRLCYVTLESLRGHCAHIHTIVSPKSMGHFWLDVVFLLFVVRVGVFGCLVGCFCQVRDQG